MSFLIDHFDTPPKKSSSRKMITLIKHVQDYCFITLDVPSSVVGIQLSTLELSYKNNNFQKRNLTNSMF